MKKKFLSILSTSMLVATLAACGTQNNSTSDSVSDSADINGSIGETLTKVDGKVYYVSPDGISSNAGTEAQPKDFLSVIQNIELGDTVYLLDGTYKMSSRLVLNQCGDALNPIKVIAKNAGKVSLDFSILPTNDNNRGVQVNGDYWYWYGIDIMRAGDNGMYIGGDYNVIDNCTFHENQDTGLQLGRAAGTYTDIKDWPHNNLIKNCTSYDNYDIATYGENADGFAAKLTVGEGNVFDGCIAYRNADDGWDLYAKSDSGNVGTTIMRNCLAFENGWVLTIKEDPDGNMSYATRDGDGNGFKLGGSNMEGSVICDNCVSFHNRLHGFTDNSNPGVITLKNCTAYDNSVYMELKNGNNELDETGTTGIFGANSGQSVNFNMARSSASYNNYYGLLSYTSNKTNLGVTYSNNDEYLGSMGYSILQSSKNAYIQFDCYMDASSYDTDKGGKIFSDMNDDIFASVEFKATVDNTIHTQLRNEDGSINLGDMLKVTDSKLLTYCEGKQIGANLSKTSWDQYEHYGFSSFSDTDTVDTIQAQEAMDVLEIMCNTNAVYQNVKLLTVVNGCPVTWSSQNEQALVVSDIKTQFTSVSNLTYVWGVVHRSSEKDIPVTLTASISVGDVTLKKDFNMVLKQNNPGLGHILNVENKYMLEAFEDFTLPTPIVTDAQSYSDLPLTVNSDYTVDTKITYAESSTAKAVNVSKVYSSVPGVYQVTYTVNSLLDDGERTLSKSFYVYVISASAPIDFTDDSKMLTNYGVEEGCTVNVSRDGVSVFGVFNNIYGDLYVATSSSVDTMTADEVIANGQKFDITDESINAIASNDNTSAYNVFIVVTSKDGTYKSEVITKTIAIEEISTNQELYDLFSGTKSSSSTTIYSLKNDLDFTDFTWQATAATDVSTFEGLFNGNGHKISNVSVATSTDKHCNLIYKIKGGTLMNVEFENINLEGDANKTTRVAIVGQLGGGYIHNVKMRNISAFGYQSVGALVGQVCGGTNYVTMCSLVNDENSQIGCTGKYCGGIIANVQKDTTELICEIYVENCYVNAEIGTNVDTGGYAGGIIGRIKGEYDVYLVSVKYCYVTGVITTHKNYAGGIIGGNESGAGKIYVISNVSDILINYAGTEIGLGKADVVKNGSPIYGRYTAGLGVFKALGNCGCIADYNKVVASDYEGFQENVYDEAFWTGMARFDMQNAWEYVKDEDGKLKAPFVQLR